MKNLILSFLISLPLVAIGQVGLEVGFSNFTGTSENWEDAESLGGLYGQLNIKIGAVILNVGTDITANSEEYLGETLTEALVILRLGMQFPISLGDSFSLNPGIKFGSYGLAFDYGGVSAASGSIGFAIGVDAVYMFNEHVGINVGIDHNIISEGEWDGDIDGIVEEFAGLSIRPGLKVFF